MTEMMVEQPPKKLDKKVFWVNTFYRGQTYLIPPAPALSHFPEQHS